MGAFYGNKIKNRETNIKTGEAWKLEDVPAFWRTKAVQWLENN